MPLVVVEGDPCAEAVCFVSFFHRLAFFFHRHYFFSPLGTVVAPTVLVYRQDSAGLSCVCGGFSLARRIVDSARQRLILAFFSVVLSEPVLLTPLCLPLDLSPTEGCRGFFIGEDIYYTSPLFFLRSSATLSPASPVNKFFFSVPSL